jgi:hypothetical protein
MNKNIIFLLVTTLILVGCTTKPLSNGESYLKTSSSSVVSKNNFQISTSIADSKKYAPFFAYDSSVNSGQPNIQPGTGGKLVLKNGCLLLQQGDVFKIPVFPSEESKWDDSKKQMVIKGVVLPLEKSFHTTGREFIKYDLSNFKTIGNPACIGNKRLESIGSDIKFGN